MSALKCKAWNKIEKVWIDEPIIDGKNGKMMGFSLLDGSFQRHFSDDEVTLVQYTGLKDKNNHEIYTGYIGWDSHLERVGVVEFQEGKFIYSWDNISSDLFELHDEIEIIGNIYESPELLKND